MHNHSFLGIIYMQQNLYTRLKSRFERGRMQILSKLIRVLSRNPSAEVIPLTNI